VLKNNNYVNQKRKISVKLVVKTHIILVRIALILYRLEGTRLELFIEINFFINHVLEDF
jgi:hypothetical protein